MTGPVPVLCYHAITDSPGSHIASFTVTPDDFARHLDLVLSAGYRCITFGQLTDPGFDRPERAAVITFDDGYADFATAALPAMQERGTPATLFLTTGWLEGRPGRRPGPSDRMLDWAQLPDLAAAGVELGAHSHSHPQLDTLSRSDLREELVRPRDLLEQALGRPVPLVAYPHGYHGPRVRRAARAAGYRAAAAVRNRLHHPGEPVYAISRLMPSSQTTVEDLSRWLAARDRRPGPRRESPATTGWRLYRRTRAVLRRTPGSDYA